MFNRPVQGVVLRQMDTEPSRVVIPHRTTKDLERQLQVCDFILDPVYDPSVALYQSTFTMRVCEHETYAKYVLFSVKDTSDCEDNNVTRSLNSDSVWKGDILVLKTHPSNVHILTPIVDDEEINHLASHVSYMQPHVYSSTHTNM